MKRLLLFISLLILWATPALSEKWPAPAGAVNDFAHVIPADQAQDLESYLDDFENKTRNAIVVVTVPSVEGGDIDGAAVELFKAWGIGQKGKDNGILILASIGDRRARIEVGYGLEGIITDGDAGDILRQQLFPAFRQQQYGRGLTNAAHAIVERLTGGAKAQPQGDQGESGVNVGEVVKIIIILVLVILYLYIRFRFGGWWGGGFYRGGGGWGGGGFGGGGGGFGGFGGGGSGGGGASGGW